MGSSVNPDGHKALKCVPSSAAGLVRHRCCARRTPPILRGVVRRALDASSRRLLLFVDAVDAAVGALEVPEAYFIPSMRVISPRSSHPAAVSHLA